MPGTTKGAIADSTVKVAGLGAGFFSRFHYEAWRRIGGAELVAVCDLDETRTLAAIGGASQTYTSLELMLRDTAPDLVDIVLPPAAQFEAIELAAAKGTSIICQKPFCGDLETARRAVELCGRAGVTLVVHENFRFQPWYRHIKALLAEGSIGTPLQATFRLRPGDGQGRDAYLNRQPYFQTMKRFLVHETAVHFIDTFRFLFGEACDVYADLHRLNPAIAGEDAGMILMNCTNGTRTLFDGNRLVDHAARNQRLTMGELLIEGTDGVLRLDGDATVEHRPRDSSDWVETPYDWHDRGFGGDCVFALQSHVIRGLQEGGLIENTGAKYLRNLEIEEAVYRSSEEQRSIAV